VHCEIDFAEGALANNSADGVEPRLGLGHVQVFFEGGPNDLLKFPSVFVLLAHVNDLIFVFCH
jgi:hypothetical protein